MTETKLASPLLVDALSFSVERHGGVSQARKGTAFPYVLHPLRVAEILRRHEYDDEVIAAGMLHDTIEDADVSAEEISERFGERVARLVEAVSEADRTLSWRERKEQTIDKVADADEDVLAILAADKLDNVRSIRDSLAERGEKKTWALFKVGRKDQSWYYRSLAEAFVARDRGSALFQTLQLEVDVVFPPESSTETRFFYAQEIRAPEAVRPHLGDPRFHWRPRYSAYELAHSWVDSGIPRTVRSVLDTSDVFRECELVEGLFEREVDLGTPGRRSQTDLLVLVRLTGGGYAVVAVEGKAAEPFGELVRDWNDSDGKQRRLDDLCGRLELTDDPDPLRYQLLHRTASALIEATRYGAGHALMLVHAFAEPGESFEDYCRFANALGVADAARDTVTSAKMLRGIELRLAWVQDEPR